MMTKKIVLTGGGTAGHVTANIALMPRLRADGYEVHYIGSYDGIEKKMMEREEVPYTGISTGKLRRYFDLRNFSDPIRVLKGYGEAKRALRRIQPDIVFSKGGFVAVPVVWAAHALHIPVVTHESDMTNIDRAEFANELGADISVKIHADGSNDGSVHGVSVLVPGSMHISDGELLFKSQKVGELVLEEFVDATGAYNRGISVRDDLTGFNWTKVPIILVEMGFMTNPDEDALMESPEYQEKMAGGIARGLLRYFENADDI